jgi:hypothetical protein
VVEQRGCKKPPHIAPKKNLHTTQETDDISWVFMYSRLVPRRIASRAPPAAAAAVAADVANAVSRR